MAMSRLDVRLGAQLETQWCWAAVAAAIHAYRVPEVPRRRQCDVVTAVTQNPDCCVHPHVHNVQGVLSDALIVLGVNAQPAPAGQISFGTIVNLVRVQALPVGVLLAIGDTGSAHNVVITGCDDQAERVVVADPWGEPGTAAPSYDVGFNELLNSYGEGGWGRTLDFFIVS